MNTADFPVAELHQVFSETRTLEQLVDRLSQVSQYLPPENNIEELVPGILGLWRHLVATRTDPHFSGTSESVPASLDTPEQETAGFSLTHQMQHFRTLRKRALRGTERSGSTSVPPESLPGNRVQVRGATCTVHGIVHNTGRRVLLAPELKNYISTAIRYSHQPRKGETYLCESSFADQFHLDPHHEMADSSRWKDYAALERTDASYSHFFPEYAPLAGVLAEERIAERLLRRLASEHKQLWSPLIHCLNQPLASVSDLERVRDLYAYIELPQPLQTDYHRFVILCLKELVCKPSWRREYVRWLSSLYRAKHMASHVTEYIQEHNLRRLHILVGLAHESYIVSFLNDMNSYGAGAHGCSVSGSTHQSRWSSE